MQSYKYIMVLLLGFAMFTQGSTQTGSTFKLPAYEKVVLKNGLTVYLMEQHEVPMINVSAILPAGAVYDGEQSGLASLTALALKHGSANMSKSQMDEALDFVGATITTFAAKEYAGINAKFATKDKDAVLNIIKEVMLNPTFDTTEFNKEKRRQLVSTVDCGSWWFNVRSSNTEPLLRLNLEASTREECDEHVAELLMLITA